MSSIPELVSLVETKNELNRKRRRFYYYLTKKEEGHIRRNQASKGYNKAAKEMRALTRPISIMRTELNAELYWNDGWMVSFIKIKESGVFIKHKDFKKIKTDYEVEQILLSRGGQ